MADELSHYIREAFMAYSEKQVVNYGKHRTKSSKQSTLCRDYVIWNA